MIPEEVILYVVQYKPQEGEEWKDLLSSDAYCKELEHALRVKEYYQRTPDHDFRIIKRGYHKSFELLEE
jgi:hypothetical protein